MLFAWGSWLQLQTTQTASIERLQLYVARGIGEQAHMQYPLCSKSRYASAAAIVQHHLVQHNLSPPSLDPDLAERQRGQATRYSNTAQHDKASAVFFTEPTPMLRGKMFDGGLLD
ncbi:MAG: hypothetical protein LQ340_007145 [Diploschistes diacapsis]|nr:MAG: hypothetical protein LQ340_007145 [Diploschistes diacapsis]